MDIENKLMVTKEEGGRRMGKNTKQNKTHGIWG